MEEVSSSDENSVVDNEWNDEREKYCRQLANSRGAFVWLHSKSSKYYYFLNKLFAVLVAIGSGVFSSVVTVVEAIPNWDDSWKVSVSFGSITVILCILGVVLQIIELDTKSVNHSEASGKSTALFIRISKEIKKPREKRAHAIKFINGLIEEDILLRNQMLHIPSYCLRKYYARFGNSAIAYNVLFGNNDLLKIEDETKNIDEIEIINRAILRMTHGIHVKSQIKLVEHPNNEPKPDDLESCLKEHDKKSKTKRTPPELSGQQLYDLEKYLDD